MNFIAGIFNFFSNLIKRVVNGVTELLKTEFGKFLQDISVETAKQIKAVITENVPVENRRGEVIKRLIVYCNENKIKYTDSYLNLAIELLYTFYKNGMLDKIIK